MLIFMRAYTFHTVTMVVSLGSCIGIYSPGFPPGGGKVEEHVHWQSRSQCTSWKATATPNTCKFRRGWPAGTQSASQQMARSISCLVFDWNFCK